MVNVHRSSPEAITADARVAVWPDGSLRLAGTRLTLDAVVEAYRMGETADQIAADYGPTEAARVSAALDYYLEHRAEVDLYLARRAAVADRFWKARECDPRVVGLGGRLRARRAEHDDAAAD